MRKIFLLLLLTAGCIPVVAQQSAPQVTNIRMTVDESAREVVIRYDLARVQATDSLFVELETAAGRKIRPAAVTGAVGKSLTAGKDKTIIWDVVRDGVNLDETVRVLIRIAQPAPATAGQPVAGTTTKPAGSPAAPKITPKRSILPVVGWVATGGLAVFSGILASGINKDVDTYKQTTVVYSQEEFDQGENVRKSIESRKSTFTVVAGATAVLAVGNIVYLLVRKSKRARTTLLIQPDNRVSSVGVTHRF